MNNNRIHKVLLYIIITSSLFFLNGCSIKVVDKYSPSILMSGKGNVNVEMFRYLPAEEGKLEKNQIDTGSGLTPIYTEENIDKLVTDAVMKEFKFIGYTLDSSAQRVIAGDILEWSVDYIGFHGDFLTKIQFFIYDNSSGKRKEIYSKVHEGKLRLSKFQQGPSGYITLTDAIESFLKDAQKEKVLN